MSLGEQNRHDQHIDWLLVLAGLLHDIGKIKHRAGSGRRHEILSAELIREYSALFDKLGIDSGRLAALIRCHHYKRSKDIECNEDDPLLPYLLEADHASAPERLRGEERGSPTTMKLVSPLWAKYYYEEYGGNYDADKARKIIGDSRICYEPVPLTSISRYGSQVEAVRDTYKATLCSVYDEKILRRRYNAIYEGIYKVFEELSELSSEDLITSETLVDTIANYLRYALLLVPDDLYWTIIPDTSLSAHSIITAALAYALQKSRSGNIVLGILDLSGIQAYISSIGRTKGALRQVRGRSLVLQLVMRASTMYLAKKLGIPMTNIVLIRGDSALLILPDTKDLEEKFNKILREINASIYTIFHGDVYVAGALSKPFKPEYTMPWDPGHGEKGFSKALIEVGEKLRINKYRKLAKISDLIMDRQEHANSGDPSGECDLCRKTLAMNDLINIKGLDNSNIRSRFNRLIEDGVEHICPACFLSYLAGSTAVNLEFIIEIEDSDIAEHLYRSIVDQRTSEAPLCGGAGDYEFAAIPFPGLARTYVLISLKPGNEAKTGQEAWRKLYDILGSLVLNTIVRRYYSTYLAGKSPNKTITINILRVNDPPSMLPPRDLLKNIEVLRGINIKYGFSNIFVNFTNKTTEEIDDLAKHGEENKTYVSWLKTDIDHMGLTGLYLSGSIGRYITLAELVNFYTNMIGHRMLDYHAYHPGEASTRLSDHVIIVFSGGDDTFAIARFVEGLYYLKYYGSWFRDFFGEIIDEKEGEHIKVQPLTLSAGYFMSEADFPAHLSYRNALEMLETAKREGRNRVTVSFLELEILNDELGATTLPINSVDWHRYGEIVDLSCDEKLLGWITSNKVLSFKIMGILRRIAEKSGALHAIGVDEHHLSRELRKSLAEDIVAYSYIFAKIGDTEKGARLKEIIHGAAKRLEVPPALPATYIDIFSKNDMLTLFSTASTFYRVFQTTYFRIKENI